MGLKNSEPVLSLLDKLKLHYIQLKHSGVFNEINDEYEIVKELLEVMEESTPKRGKLRIIK